MKDFFSSVFFKIIIALFIICVGAFTYTLTFSGSATPVTSISGILLTPFQNIITSVTGFFDDIKQQNFEYDELVLENQQLKNELKQAESDLRKAEYSINENESLKAILGIQQTSPSFEFEIAEVIGKSSTNLNNILTIDKGTNVGLELNSAVITEDGLVGYISRVSYNNAQITTVLDPSLQVGSISSSTREVGISEGNLEFLEDDLLKLSYLDKNTNIKIGDTIETSGIGGLYPKGIMIGTVTSVLIENHGISKYAVIEPSVDLSTLDHVYIIKSFETVAYEN